MFALAKGKEEDAMLLTDLLAKSLNDNLNIIKNKCQEIHRDRYLISFTKHDYDHSERMVELITGLIAGSSLSNGDQQLNEYETFILLSSIYLHDIGIQIYKDDVLICFAKETKIAYDTNWPEEKKQAFVRSNHHLLSAFWIRDSMKKNNHMLPLAYIGDREIGEKICLVVISHGIDFFTKTAYTQTVEYEGKEIRMRLLCELLCLADSLDCDKRRIDYDKLKTNETPDISMLHWMKHYYCNSVSTKAGQVRITFKFPQILDGSQQEVYSTYFKHNTEYWIKYCQEKYKEDFANYRLNFSIIEKEEYGDKDALDESLYIVIEDQVVDILVPPESLMSPKSVAIGILVYDGKVVMVQRKEKEGCLKWQFPAGFIKNGQVAEQRVIEEFENETGIKAQCVQKIGRRIHPNTRVISIYYALKYVSGTIINGDTRENSACEWVDLEEYQERITSNLYIGIKRYLDAEKASELEEKNG